MADDTRHLWHPIIPNQTKCGEPVGFGMKMTDDTGQSDCPACKQ